jgi:hypothetical protein
MLDGLANCFGFGDAIPPGQLFLMGRCLEVWLTRLYGDHSERLSRPDLVDADVSSQRFVAGKCLEFQVNCPYSSGKGFFPQRLGTLQIGMDSPRIETIHDHHHGFSCLKPRAASVVFGIFDHAVVVAETPRVNVTSQILG